MKSEFAWVEGEKQSAYVPVLCAVRWLLYNIPPCLLPFSFKALTNTEGNDLYHEMIETGVIQLKNDKSKAALVFGQMNEPPGARARVALTGLTIAEYFRDVEGQDVLLFIDVGRLCFVAVLEKQNKADCCSLTLNRTFSDSPKPVQRYPPFSDVSPQP